MSWCWGRGGSRADGSPDQAHHDLLRRDARTDRRDGLLPAHAPGMQIGRQRFGVPSHTCVIAAESRLTLDTAGTAPPLPPPAVRMTTRTWKEIERLTRCTSPAPSRSGACDLAVEVPGWPSSHRPQRDCAGPLHHLDDVERSRRFYTEVSAAGSPSRRSSQSCARRRLDRNRCRRRPDRRRPNGIVERRVIPTRSAASSIIRVKDIEAVYAEWSARVLNPDAAETAPVREALLHPRSRRSSDRSGANTDPEGDSSPAHWPSSSQRGVE